jgi:hypothetical protein
MAGVSARIRIRSGQGDDVLKIPVTILSATRHIGFKPGGQHNDAGLDGEGFDLFRNRIRADTAKRHIVARFDPVQAFPAAFIAARRCGWAAAV